MYRRFLARGGDGSTADFQSVLLICAYDAVMDDACELLMVYCSSFDVDEVVEYGEAGRT